MTTIREMNDAELHAEHGKWFFRMVEARSADGQELSVKMVELIEREKARRAALSASEREAK